MNDGFIFDSERKTKMIEYFMPLTDRYGYTHSLDNMVLFYLTNIDNNELLDIVQKEKTNYAYLEYWERLDCPACSHFGNFQHIIHFGDLYIRIGKIQKRKSLTKGNYVEVIDCVSFEINPNKHHATKEFAFMLDLINRYCRTGKIDKVDYAIDIPLAPGHIVVPSSRKKFGQFDGSRYYGRRNAHGRVKIYDKFKERMDSAKAIAKKLNIDFPNFEDYYECTRIETTLKNGNKYSSVDFMVTGNIPTDTSGLSPTCQLYLDMLQHIVSLGGDIEPHLRKMNYRARVQVEPFIYGSMVRYDIETEMLEQLLRNCEDFYNVQPFNFNALGTFVSADSDELMIFNDDSDDDYLPLPDDC